MCFFLCSLEGTDCRGNVRNRVRGVTGDAGFAGESRFTLIPQRVIGGRCVRVVGVDKIGSNESRTLEARI